MPATHPLVERERETAALERALKDAANREGSAVLIEAAPGLGKTTLLDHAAERARGLGFQIFRARGSDLERNFAHGCVRQLFETTARRKDARSLFAGAAHLARSVLLDPGTEATSPDTAFAALHGLYWFTANLAETAPLLIALDDAHWADTGSLQYAAHLAHRLEGLPVALLVASRPLPVADTEDLRLRLRATPTMTHLTPGALSADGANQLLRSVLRDAPSDDLAAACYRASAGNPFFLTTLGRQARDAGARSGPAVARLSTGSVAASILLTIRTADRDATAVARALAVAGDGTEVDDLAAIADVEPRRAAVAIDRLSTLALLTRDSRPAFVHPVVQETVYGDLATQESRALHLRAAAVLRRRGAHDETLAAHLLLAAPTEEIWAVETLRRAARTSLGQGAPEPAIAYLQRAAVLNRDPAASGDLEAELARAEHLAGDPRAEARIRALLAREPGRPDRSEVAQLLILQLQTSGRYAEGAAETRRFLGTDARTVSGQAGLFLRARCALLQMNTDPSSGAAAIQELAEHASPETALGRLVLVGLAELRLMEGRSIDDLLPAIEAAAPALVADEHPSPIATVLFCLSAADSRIAVECTALALREAQARGWLLGAALAVRLRAGLDLQRGQLGPAEAGARWTLDHTDQLPFLVPAALACLIGSLVEQGRVDEARVEHDRWRPTSAPMSTLRPETLRLGAARLALAEGDSVRALAELGPRDWEYDAPDRTYERWRPLAVAAHLGVGDRQTAERLATEELSLSRAMAVPLWHGAALRSLASVRPNERVPLLTDAVDALRSSHAPLELAKALTDLGAALRSSQRGEARELLEEGLELGEACGAAPVATRARAELAALGVTPRGRRTLPVDYLTASERQVCDLAVTGLSNPEIAQSLFVTRKTIEKHLSSAYAKLGIDGRAQLAAALSPGEGAR